MQKFVARTTVTLTKPLGVGVFRTFGNTFKDMEKSQEKIYFDKEERRALERILSKMKDQVDETLIKTTSEERNSQILELKSIFERHRVKGTDALFDELYTWKTK